MGRYGKMEIVIGAKYKLHRPGLIAHVTTKDRMYLHGEIHGEGIHLTHLWNYRGESLEDPNLDIFPENRIENAKDAEGNC